MSVAGEIEQILPARSEGELVAPSTGRGCGI